MVKITLPPTQKVVENNPFTPEKVRLAMAQAIGYIASQFTLAYIKKTGEAPIQDFAVDAETCYQEYHRHEIAWRMLLICTTIAAISATMGVLITNLTFALPMGAIAVVGGIVSWLPIMRRQISPTAKRVAKAWKEPRRLLQKHKIISGFALNVICLHSDKLIPQRIGKIINLKLQELAEEVESHEKNGLVVKRKKLRNEFRKLREFGLYLGIEGEYYEMGNYFTSRNINPDKK